MGADPLAEGASDEAQPADEEREGNGMLNKARILVSLVAIFWTFKRPVSLCHTCIRRQEPPKILSLPAFGSHLKEEPIRKQ